jgi:thiol-disulfide isomerase/thioredoxin
VLCFLWILLDAPHIEQLRGKEKLSTALSAVTAAVVGVVLNLAVSLSIHVLVPDGHEPDLFVIAVSAIAFAGMVKWKWDVIPVVIGAGVSGLITEGACQIKRILLPIVIGLIYVGLPLVSLAALAPKESTEFDGQTVTDFALQAPDGSVIGLRNFRGHPVIVEFFATWCPPCRAQLTQLAKLHDKYADQGLAIFAFAVDPFETPETAKHVGPLALTMQLPFPVGGATRELANDYHYKGFPTTIVLDGEGKIARTFFGYHEMEKLETLVKALLGVKK